MEREVSGTERRVSATEARVRFGDLLDGVTARHDVVFVEGAGKEVARGGVCGGLGGGVNAMLAELHERLRAEGAIERLKDFNVEGAIRVGRDDWGRQRVVPAAAIRRGQRRACGATA
jgi:hypothetical protein